MDVIHIVPYCASCMHMLSKKKQVLHLKEKWRLLVLKC